MPTEQDLQRARITPGGHLSIGEYGATLFYDNCRCSGFDADEIKQQAIEAGVPVIDSREIPYGLRAELVMRGPMIAVNHEAVSPLPWHSMSYAPLADVAAAYARAGAEVHNIPDGATVAKRFLPAPPVPAADAVRFWLKAIRN